MPFIKRQNFQSNKNSIDNYLEYENFGNYQQDNDFGNNINNNYLSPNDKFNINNINDNKNNNYINNPNNNNKYQKNYNKNSINVDKNNIKRNRPASSKKMSKKKGYGNDIQNNNIKNFNINDNNNINLENDYLTDFSNNNNKRVNNNFNANINYSSSPSPYMIKNNINNEINIDKIKKREKENNFKLNYILDNLKSLNKTNLQNKSEVLNLKEQYENMYNTILTKIKEYSINLKKLYDQKLKELDNKEKLNQN